MYHVSPFYLSHPYFVCFFPSTYIVLIFPFLYPIMALLAITLCFVILVVVWGVLVCIFNFHHLASSVIISFHLQYYYLRINILPFLTLWLLWYWCHIFYFSVCYKPYTAFFLNLNCWLYSKKCNIRKIFYIFSYIVTISGTLHFFLRSKFQPGINLLLPGGLCLILFVVQIC